MDERVRLDLAHSGCFRGEFSPGPSLGPVSHQHPEADGRPNDGRSEGILFTCRGRSGPITYYRLLRRSSTCSTSRATITRRRRPRTSWHTLWPDPGSQRCWVRCFVQLSAELCRGRVGYAGEDHYRHRKIMNPAFSGPQLRSFLPLFQRIAGKVCYTAALK